MKSTLLFYLFVLSNLILFAQEKNDEKEYLLEAPDTWRKELLTLPLGFAPELAYEGIEDVRFSKGWGDINSEEFFTYTFVWYLDKNPELTSTKIENELAIYFDGLMNAVGQGRKIPKEKITPTLAVFIDDTSTNSFKGRVKIFDVFFTKKVITLNVKITTNYCNTTKKYSTYFEFSPQSFEHKLWNILHAIKIPCN